MGTASAGPHVRIALLPKHQSSTLHVAAHTPAAKPIKTVADGGSFGIEAAAHVQRQSQLPLGGLPHNRHLFLHCLLLFGCDFSDRMSTLVVCRQQRTVPWSLKQNDHVLLKDSFEDSYQIIVWPTGRAFMSCSAMHTAWAVYLSAQVLAAKPAKKQCTQPR